MDEFDAMKILSNTTAFKRHVPVCLCHLVTTSRSMNTLRTLETDSGKRTPTISGNEFIAWKDYQSIITIQLPNCLMCFT